MITQSHCPQIPKVALILPVKAFYYKHSRDRVIPDFYNLSPFLLDKQGPFPYSALLKSSSAIVSFHHHWNITDDTLTRPIWSQWSVFLLRGDIQPWVNLRKGGHVPKVGFAGVAVPFMEIPTYWLSWGSRNPLKRENRPHNRGLNTGMGK